MTERRDTTKPYHKPVLKDLGHMAVVTRKTFTKRGFKMDPATHVRNRGDRFP